MQLLLDNMTLCDSKREVKLMSNKNEFDNLVDVDFSANSEMQRIRENERIERERRMRHAAKLRRAEIIRRKKINRIKQMVFAWGVLLLCVIVAILCRYQGICGTRYKTSESLSWAWRANRTKACCCR